MLLDTHIFLWWLFDDAQLSNIVRNHLENAKQTIYVSSASVWEITTKYRLGKLPQAESIAKNVPNWIIKAGFTPMPVSPEHAQLAGSWAIDHKDPFDRMLAAQAKLEKMPLISVDTKLRLFGVDLLY